MNFKTVDNILAGVEVNKIKDVQDDPWGEAYMDGALIVGRSKISAADMTLFAGTAQDSGFAADNVSPHGIITPQRDFWRVKNARFYNFDFHEAAVAGGCSHCFKEPATDSGARTVTFEEFYIDEATVTKRVRH